MAQRAGKSRVRPQKLTKGKGKRYDGDFSKFKKKEEEPTRTPVQRKNKVMEQAAKNSTIQLSKDGTMRLNKYIAHAGVCSRREADKLIETGAITINGKIVTELGHKVKRGDKVHLDGQLLRAEQLQYVLLNKPKGFVTTTDDPQARKTVMDLIKQACNERIYPVGRLDLKTTGLLLFTNDGDMAKKLTHPKHRVRKVYHVYLDKALTKNDMLRIAEGIELEDGILNVDKISYVEDVKSKQEIGIQIHSGKNRIVRRLFEHLGYEVVKLDRVVFAGLTKKDLPRGKWRHLTAKELDFLKII